MKPSLFYLFISISILYCKKDPIDTVPFNSAPMANAGADQTITLPQNTITLNGSGSTDPENNILLYVWTKISGASLFNTSNGAILSKVNLGLGDNLFELKVTDAGELISKDTIKVRLNYQAPSLSPCMDSPRPDVNAELIPIGSLSQTRPSIALISKGNKIFFAGGEGSAPPFASSRVDIFDAVANTWTTAELSMPRWQIATVAAGNKVFFAGGVYYEDADNRYPLAIVDIYDVSTNTWSIDSLSEPGGEIATATVGDKVFFAGYNKIDIYNLSTNSWSDYIWSESRYNLTALASKNKVFFAGGRNGLQASTRVDVYDELTDSWSVSAISEARYNMGGVAVADKIYWAGGSKIDQGNNKQILSCTVEIQDVHSASSSFASIFRPRNFFINQGQNAVVQDDKIIFFTGGRRTSESLNRFDIYDITHNTWSNGVLPQLIDGASIISVNNTIYVAGGYVNGALTNQVWRLEF